MRLFIAIDLPGEMKEELVQIQKEIVPFTNGGNFTKKENLHLTIYFAGECDTEEKGLLLEAMAQATMRCKAFPLTLSSLGFFPKTNIIWAGLEKSQALSQFVMRMNQSLEFQGFPRSKRPFQPHITLVRQANLTKGKRMDEILSGPQKTVMADGVTLMESAFVRGTLQYRALDQSLFR